MAVGSEGRKGFAMDGRREHGHNFRLSYLPLVIFYGARNVHSLGHNLEWLVWKNRPCIAGKGGIILDLKIGAPCAFLGGVSYLFPSFISPL